MHDLAALGEDTPAGALVRDLLYLIARWSSFTLDGLSSFGGAKVHFEDFQLSSDHVFHVAENDHHHEVYAIEMPLVDILFHFLNFAEIRLDCVHVEAVEAHGLAS